MNITIKHIQTVLGLDYKTVVAELTAIDPTLKPTPSKVLDDTLVTQICQNHGVSIEFAGDKDAEDGRLTISRSTEDNVKVAPLNPVIPTEATKVNPYEANKAKALLRSDLIKLNAKRKVGLSEAEAFDTVEKLTDARKILISEADLRDANMIDMLLEGMVYLIIPAALPKRTRDFWKPASVKSIITERINTHLIAFNDKQVLYIYF